MEHALAVRNGELPRAQRELVVTQDADVRLAWTSDRPLTVHLEGYDISVFVRPGETATMRFRARATGRFPAHAHEGERKGGGHSHGRSALLRLEVHPK